jgi:hypothetical protein
MPTVKPRITITLTEQQHAVLSSLAGLQRVSMSSIVVDLLDTTLPVLERLAGVLHNASTAPQHVLDELRRTAHSAENELSGIGPSVMGLLDEMVDLSSAPDSTATGRREAGAEDRPPTSNRGVRNTVPASKIAHISPMKKGEKHGRSQK